MIVNTHHSKPLIFGCHPFASFDLDFAVSAVDAGVFPIVKIAHSDSIEEKIFPFSQELNSKFGILLCGVPQLNFSWPVNLEFIILPAGTDISNGHSIKIIYQVTSFEQALEAQRKNAYGVIAKGNESGGLIGDDASYILFQKLIKKINIPVWVQGGVGVHTSAALVALGASGIFLDFQFAFFRECKLQAKLTSILKHLDGSETKVLYSHRVFAKPGLKKIDENIAYDEFLNLYTEFDPEKELLAMSQDIGNAFHYYQKYKKLKYFIAALKESMTGHAKQAKYFEPLKPHNALAKKLGITYPIAQGPMTRVSDVPEFAKSVAESGALPFLALSLTRGQNAYALLTQTKQLMHGKTWGVGILGFIADELLNEQLKIIEELRPPVVLIAGGRPSQAKPLEKLGIKVFLHVPSVGLLDSFLKEGAQGFIFEGRECGGHVGPLSSFVLWEKQITRLLQEEDLNNVDVFFAGGIHDDLSSSMISVMAAPLVARGAKIGILIGTSYIFTKEAVETGAILKQFQQEAIKGTETSLLESMTGHVSRCLKTPFVDYFNDQKKELTSRLTNNKEIGYILEGLNVGRLRIATKGIERQGDKLISVNHDDQLKQGLYMIGQVATIRDSVISMAQLHENITVGGNNILQNIELPVFSKTTGATTDIAIIGMACIFPQARNIDEYWKNILQSKDSISEVPENRWSQELYYDPKAQNGTKSPSKWGGFIPTIDFDPLEFGIPPQSLAAIEPVQLLSLKVAKDALKDAGYDKKEFDRDFTAVIFAAENGSELAFGYELRGYFPHYFGMMPDELDQVLPKLTEDSFPGVLRNIVSGRIANRLDLGGKNYTVDAACGSSLAALDMACQELLMGSSNMVLVGAGDLHNGINDYLKFSSAQALTSEGHCKTFDQSADGMSLGEGIAVVVLKRLEDAKIDGDKIYAVIKSVGGSSDGKSLGLTAPNKKGQIKAFERAYYSAGISPSEIGLIEAHGTGTVVGDKTELSSMTEMMSNAGALPGQTQLGSVKTQIGHTKCAAGLAGLIRASLSVYHGIKPPTLNINNPNVYYDQSLSPFVFNDKASPWLNKKRIAGVSAFGFGGTNFHAILENINPYAADINVLKQWPAELFVFRALDHEELKQLLSTVNELLKINRTIPLKDLAYTLTQLNQKPIMLTIIAENVDDLLVKIDAALKNKPLSGIYMTKNMEGKIAFLFSGQGSQRLNMVRDLFNAFPEMRKLLYAHPEFEKIVFPHKAFDQESIEKQKETIIDTRNAQPLLGIVDYAIAGFLISLGVNPDMLAGHSYGEVPALCISGAIKEKDLVEISKNRAISILNAIDGDPGEMVAVSCDEEALKSILEGEDGVTIVNHNSPHQWVIAGSKKDISRICNKLLVLNKSFKKLPVACAFHSPLIAHAQKIFEEALTGYHFDIPKIPVWSNTNAEVYPSDPDLIKKRLCEHLVKPVRFCDEILNMYEAGARIFIETGPGNVLTKLTRDIIREPIITLNTEQSTGNGLTKLIDTLAQFIACGREINFERLFKDRQTNLIDLETIEKYAFSKALWKIDGCRAIPVNGKLPANGATPITKPLVITGKMNVTREITHAQETDKILLEYLENVQSLIKSQHQIMVSYLGNDPGNGDYQITNELPENNVNVKETLSTHSAIEQEPGNNQPRLMHNTDIKSILLETVCEKTGYPLDMLDMTMDLEADLSIDSIKRVEIIGVLKDKLGLTNDQDDEIVEKLASIKTLNGLVEWLSASINPVQNVAGEALHSAASGKEVSITEGSLKDFLLKTVSEKTGYPIDMLDMNMDMEADLSIDSIKRIEVINDLKQKLGGFHFSNFNEDEAVEKLASIKTLSGLMDWLVVKPGDHGTVRYTLVHDNLTPLQTGDTLTFEQIKKILLDAICEKTGYPIDMLDMNMDMEADLSIDSIKRIEIINIVKSKITLHTSQGINEDDIVEKLASIKTLHELTTWIFNSSEVDKCEVSFSEPVKESPNKSALSPGEEILSFVIEIVKSKTLKSNTNLLKGKKIAITDDGGLISENLKTLLEFQYGAIANIVNDGDSLENYAGFIALELFNASKRTDITSFFSSVQKLNYKDVNWVFAVTDIKRHLKEHTNDNFVDDLQGYAGFLNSLNKEWQATCRVINIEDEESIDSAALIIIDELCYQDHSTETFYRSGERYVSEFKKMTIEAIKPAFRLEQDSVVLVLGGAQGITAEILKELSLEMPCHYILAGRSPMPETIKDNITAQEVNDIRKLLLAKEIFRSPAELEHSVQQIYKRNQILLTIDTLQKRGSTVHYHSIDLTNEEAMEQWLNHLYQEYGKIDGVIHAVGYLDDKFFHKKTLDSFKKVFNTKVTPLKVLSKHLREDTKFCIFFSSIASVMGNKGQVDYASANCVLDQAAVVLNNKIKGRVMSINWGPWKGKGMISEVLEKDLLKRGISSIPLSLGAKAFVDQLKFGTESQVILMTRIEALIQV